MSLLARLFGKAPAKTQDPILHKDCRIFPEPQKAPGGFRVAARIEKDFDGQTRTHNLIRSDIHASLDDATEASLAKARLAIDQLGDTIFS
ncbi:HlyU family transcriptional regulator [Stagnihabitans tardus]|uniref:Transcriptional activator HlyU n=1 Tax=Stagnihabitans tardus TaxID=2699202 RepID=A0AAE4Y8W6_9RHOB|nr:HlyU family transcriptional regulator [Stagnihabitans tardus]NBZ87116.1 hypothetical protein [Stagnihabitans tardus]